MQTAVELREVSKKFAITVKRSNDGRRGMVSGGVETRDFWALRDISLSIRQGCLFGIVGDNGSGKSTLLKIIAGITAPDGGSVVTRGSVAALMELGAGFHPDFTGMENIFLYGSLLGLSRDAILRNLPDIISFSGLERFLHLPVKHYSSGMLVRLGFSVAMSVNPDILLIDEALGVGDADFQFKSFERIKDFQREGKTILFATHEIDVTKDFCDEVLWLENGTIRAVGNPLEINYEYRKELFARINKEQGYFWHLSGEGASVPPSAAPSARITSVRLLSETREPRETFYTGKEMVVELDYAIAEPIQNPCFNFVVLRDDNVIISDIYSREKGLILEDLCGKGTLRLCVRPLILMRGNYSLSIFIFDYADRTKVYAAAPSCCRFEVQNDEFPYPNFVADLPCAWSVESK